MIAVYRVENKNGIGPYMGKILLGSWVNYMLKEHDDKEHPTWEDDVNQKDYRKIKKIGDFVFSSGFITVEQAEDWFEGWLIPLGQSGFYINSYTIHPKTIIHTKSGKQIIFKKP